MSTNLIFLDVDGVLNSSKFFRERDPYDGPEKDFRSVVRNSWEVDPKAVAILARICDETDARIVISSTWRSLPDNNFQIWWWENLFEICGWDNPIILGRTNLDDEMPFWKQNIFEDGHTEIVAPTWSEMKGQGGHKATIDGHHRGHQIIEWLQENPGDYNYAVIDDDHFDIFKIIPKDRFFRTCFTEGLTDEIADAIIEKLNDGI